MSEIPQVHEVHEELGELAKISGDTPVAPAHGIAAIALSIALKYADINTVQEGALYQQFKLEGKNMQPLHLDVVLDTATRIEAWLLGASERLAKLVIDAMTDAVEEPDTKSPGGESQSP